MASNTSNIVNCISIGDIWSKATKLVSLILLSFNKIYFRPKWTAIPTLQISAQFSVHFAFISLSNSFYFFDRLKGKRRSFIMEDTFELLFTQLLIMHTNHSLFRSTIHNQNYNSGAMFFFSFVSSCTLLQYEKS